MSTVEIENYRWKCENFLKGDHSRGRGLETRAGYDTNQSALTVTRNIPTVPELGRIYFSINRYLLLQSARFHPR